MARLYLSKTSSTFIQLNETQESGMALDNDSHNTWLPPG